MLLPSGDTDHHGVIGNTVGFNIVVIVVPSKTERFLERFEVLVNRRGFIEHRIDREVGRYESRRRGCGCICKSLRDRRVMDSDFLLSFRNPVLIEFRKLIDGDFAYFPLCGFNLNVCLVRGEESTVEV